MLTVIESITYPADDDRNSTVITEEQVSMSDKIAQIKNYNNLKIQAIVTDGTDNYTYITGYIPEGWCPEVHIILIRKEVK